MKQKLIATTLRTLKSKDQSVDERELGYLYDDLLVQGLLTMEILEVWDTSVARLYSGEPLQYVSGIAHFYNHIFKVDHRVLIPRPETEELVHQVVKELKDHKGYHVSVLDVGTGSGCIPISIKLAYQSAQVTALDISQSALDMAIENAAVLEADVDFKLIDFIDAESWATMGTYDMIVSNPPYIPVREQSLMSDGVLDYEPHIALFVEDSDPLLFYRLLAEFGISHLASQGYIYAELNEYNAIEVSTLYHSYDYKNIEILQDLQGKDRILKCQR